MIRNYVTRTQSTQRNKLCSHVLSLTQFQTLSILSQTHMIPTSKRTDTYTYLIFIHVHTLTHSKTLCTRTQTHTNPNSVHTTQTHTIPNSVHTYPHSYNVKLCPHVQIFKHETLFTRQTLTNYVHTHTIPFCPKVHTLTRSQTLSCTHTYTITQ